MKRPLEPDLSTLLQVKKMPWPMLFNLTPSVGGVDESLTSNGNSGTMNVQLFVVDEKLNGVAAINCSARPLFQLWQEQKYGPNKITETEQEDVQPKTSAPFFRFSLNLLPKQLFSHNENHVLSAIYD